MKRIISLIALVCALMTLLATSCGGNPTPDADWTPSNVDVTVADSRKPSNTTIVYSPGLDGKASALASVLETAGIAGVKTASAALGAKHVIAIGKTDYKASELAANLYEEAFADAKDDYHWAFAYFNGTLAIYADTDLGYEKAFAALVNSYVDGDKLVVRDTLSQNGVYTKAEHEAYLDQIAEAEEEARKQANAALIPALVAKVEEQRTFLITYKAYGSPYDSKDTPTLIFQNYTADLGLPLSGSTTVTPGDEHPRLLINSSMYENIKDTLRADNAQTREFKRLLEMVIPNDCILPARSDHGYNATVDSNNIHNINYEYLEAIQAKALANAVYGDSYYGYQAIFYMKNFLKSLDIERMANDQCRDFGYIMYTSALVYDWCYDLLTAEDKVQFIAGVENIICRGSNKAGKKMEVGFPPELQGSVADHACEYQILRDYLSFAVAIYDENPSWWNFTAGRVYNEYIPMRNYYFQSGIAPQGTGVYISARHIGDIYSAWILQIATGTNPYVGLENTMRNILSYEVFPGYIFNDGDGDGPYVKADRFSDMVYMSAYLYGDEGLLAQADYLLGNNYFNYKYHEKGYAGISNPAYIALTGLGKIEASEDRYEKMTLITYNGYPVGQYIIHSAWDDPASVSVFMRIKERSTSNHEHYDAGTFEIYYKGMLTSDGGVYNNYSSTHVGLYHQQTISHNGIIIYNPTKAKTQGGWYSGGQRDFGGTASDLNGWLGMPGMTSGTVVGRQHAYANDDPSDPIYAYIAGDISAAYPTDTASYVGRRMLTVFTDDESYPMVFFVFDSITSVAGCERRFLLQISSDKEPTITTKKNALPTVTTENGDGKLVLTCLTPTVLVNGVGGRNSGKYDANKSQNYLIQGKQCVPQDPTRDDGHWGRVEIVYASGNTDATFMNVIYVTDKGNKKAATVESIENAVGLEGGVFQGKIAGLFATSRTGAKTTLSCTTKGEGTMSYYVSGVKAGSWTVTVDGTTVGTFTATAEGGLLTFEAPAGNVTITPAS